MLALFLLVLALGVRFSADENVRLSRLGTFAVSSRDGTVVLLKSDYLPGTDASHSTLHLLTPLGIEAVCPEHTHAGNLIYSAATDNFYFTSPLSGVTGLYALCPRSLRCSPLTDLPVDIGSVQLSPDATFLVFSADVYLYLDQARPLSAAAAETKRLEELPYSVKAFDSAYILHWDEELWPEKFRHLFIARIPEKGYVHEEDCVDVMPGFEGDAPLKPFGDIETFSISSDSRRLAFVTQVGPTRPWTTNDSIYLVDIETGHDPHASLLTSEPRCLTCDNVGRDAIPVFSPTNPDLLFYLSMNEASSESDMLRLRSLDLKSGKKSAFLLDYDGSFDSFFISSDSSTIYLSAVEKARSVVYACELDDILEDEEFSDACTQVLTGGAISQVVRFEDKLIFGMSSLVHPADIFAAHIRGGEHRQLTQLNAHIMADWEPLYAPDEFYVKSKDDDAMVHSFFHYPQNDFDPERDECKLVLYIHGGPESPWEDSWSYRWNPQTLVSEGYCVLATNFHGSGSFGEEFQKAIREHWFDIPVHDVMDAWNYVLEHYPFVSREKTCAMGASYGGTHVNWLMGHTDNITCFISHDGIFDLTAFGLDTDELFFPLREMGGLVWDAFETFEKWNPARSANRFSAPALVIHGGYDFRIHKYHGIALFQALQLRGIPSRFVYFPTQSHWVWQPQESLVWHNEVLGWLRKYLADE